MRLTVSSIAMAAFLVPVCLAQNWELGASGGYGWYVNPSITNNAESANGGFPPRASMGAVFGQNMYNYIGGEIRWLFLFGGPQVETGGTRLSMTGYSNLITYDFLFHMTRRESKFRPFVAGGAGVRVYTSTGQHLVGGSTADLALLTPCTQTEPVISVGGGMKYMLPKHLQLRVDFRTYMTPLPNELIRPTGFSAIHGWVYDFVPQAGIGYVF